MRAGFEYYRGFPVDAEQNKRSATNKIIMSVLVLGRVIYPAVGWDFPGNLGLSSTQALAANETGVMVPLSRHQIPEEQPEFVIDRFQILWEQHLWH